MHAYLHALQNLNQEQRETLQNIADAGLEANGLMKRTSEKRTLTQAIAEEAENLLAIQGVKEVTVLNDADRVYLFENEEDRNHAVYETLKRQALLCLTHDASFRAPDAAIVHQRGEKVIFPAVSFNEVRGSRVVSASPSLKTHQYLIGKFKNPDAYDATVLVGFDL